MGATERRKGAVAEREVASVLADMGIHATRAARNGVQRAEDIRHSLPMCHIEVKRTERLRLHEAMRQAVDAAGGKAPMVVHRRSREEWMVTLRLEDLPHIAAAYAAAIGRPVYPLSGETRSCRSDTGQDSEPVWLG